MLDCGGRSLFPMVLSLGGSGSMDFLGSERAFDRGMAFVNGTEAKFFWLPAIEDFGNQSLKRETQTYE